MPSYTYSLFPTPAPTISSPQSPKRKPVPPPQPQSAKPILPPRSALRPISPIPPVPPLEIMTSIPSPSLSTTELVYSTATNPPDTAGPSPPSPLHSNPPLQNHQDTEHAQQQQPPAKPPLPPKSALRKLRRITHMRPFSESVSLSTIHSRSYSSPAAITLNMSTPTPSHGSKKGGGMSEGQSSPVSTSRGKGKVKHKRQLARSGSSMMGNRSTSGFSQLFQSRSNLDLDLSINPQKGEGGSQKMESEIQQDTSTDAEEEPRRSRDGSLDVHGRTRGSSYPSSHSLNLHHWYHHSNTQITTPNNQNESQDRIFTENHNIRDGHPVESEIKGETSHSQNRTSWFTHITKGFMAGVKGLFCCGRGRCGCDTIVYDFGREAGVASQGWIF